MERDEKISAERDDGRLLLHAYVDNELSLPDTIAVRSQLAADAALAAEAKAVLGLKQALLEKLPQQPAPPQLRARIAKAIGLRRRAAPPIWMALAASLVVAVLGSAIATDILFRVTDGEMIDGQFMDSHFRALRATRPVDVESSDRHTVKPWFDGKSILSPQVVDLSAQGFPLVGGRIDVIRDSVVPVVVYSRRLHLIDVWALPSGFTRSVDRGARAWNGHNIVPFTAHGARYLAASNLAADELEAFTKLLQAAQ